MTCLKTPSRNPVMPINPSGIHLTRAEKDTLDDQVASLPFPENER